MGILDFNEDKKIKKCIERRLKSRGLILDESEEWDIHGPHPEMDYQVYIGRVVYDDQHRSGRAGFRTYVVIYPRAVYEIDSPSDWYRVEPENRIAVLDENDE